MRFVQFFLATVLTILTGPVLSQEDGGKWGMDFQSFALGTYAARIGNEWPKTSEGRRFLLAEERLRFELNLWPILPRLKSW